MEEQIAFIEADVKAINGAKSSVLKAQLVSLEAELHVLRERQKKERPLPARLQAATHRLEKAKAARTEAAELVTDLEEKLIAAKVGLDEAESKLLEAEQKLTRYCGAWPRSSPRACGPLACSTTSRWRRPVVLECR